MNLNLKNIKLNTDYVRSFVIEHIFELKSLKVDPNWPTLREAYEYVVKNNKSNNLPYHNLFHHQSMVINCFNGGFEEGLSNKELYLLLLAAIFHDFNHSGGKLADAENIVNAVQGFEEFLLASNHYDLELFSLVSDNIKVTQYPFLRDPQNRREAIIRDADLMQGFEQEWYMHIIVGLRSEMETMHQKKITIKDMLAGQLKFFDGAKFYTKYGQDRFNENWPILKAQIEDLLDSYEKQ